MNFTATAFLPSEEFSATLDGGWTLPWGGWEEILQECGPLPAEETGDFHSDGSPVKVESTDFDGFQNHLLTPGDDILSGESADISSFLYDDDGNMDLMELFNGFEPSIGQFHDSPPEKDVVGFPHSETLLQLLTENNVDDFLGSVTENIYQPTEDDICVTSLEELEEEECETSPFSERSSEYLVEPEYGSTGINSSEEGYHTEHSGDDTDWEWPRRCRSKRKRKRSSAAEPSKKMRMDTKTRKKEQNKNAAIRYREKKRGEEFEKFAMCELLDSRNTELRKEIKDKEQEVRVLRQLLVDVLRPASLKN